MSPCAWQESKMGASVRGSRSRNPDQGAQVNSAWPTPPITRARSKHCSTCSRAGRAQVGRFPGSSNLDARASVSDCHSNPTLFDARCKPAGNTAWASHPTRSPPRQRMTHRTCSTPPPRHGIMEVRVYQQGSWVHGNGYASTDAHGSPSPDSRVEVAAGVNSHLWRWSDTARSRDGPPKPQAVHIL